MKLIHILLLEKVHCVLTVEDLVGLIRKAESRRPNILKTVRPKNYNKAENIKNRKPK